MAYFIKFVFVVLFSYSAYGADKPLAEFHSDRLNYALLQEAHQNQVVDLLADPQVGQAYWTHGAKTRKWVQGRVTSDIQANAKYLKGTIPGDYEKFRWVVFEKNQFVGIAGINFGLGDGDFVIAVSPNHHGRGLGTEMEKTIVDQLFTHTDLEEIIHEADPDNQGSRRIAEKCGFEFKYDYDQPIPTVVYGLDRQTWERLK